MSAGLLLGRLRGARFRLRSVRFLLPFGHCASPSGGAWDACAARGKVGPVMGLRPLLGPPCIPPEAPPKRSFNYRKTTRARVLCCGSFPHSLRSLRRSPSATRKCQSTLSLRAKAASVNNHRHVWWLKKVLYPSSAATRFAMRFHLLTHLNNR